MRPLCSVIVPTYNAATYLAEALDSALEQTYQPIEVVVIDDGSTDDTAQVLDGYGDRIVRRFTRGCLGRAPGPQDIRVARRDDSRREQLAFGQR